MSGATYRIDVVRKANEPEMLRWCATAIRLSDDWPMFSAHGRYADDAVNNVRAWIRAEDESEAFSVFVDEFGETVESHSVKA